MNSQNNKYQINKYISWSVIFILLVFTSFLYGCTQVVETSQLQVRDRLYYKINSETPYTGRVVDKYTNGQKRVEGTYKDGKREGLNTKWYENGQKKEELTFKDGRPINKKWDKDGNRLEL